jgi:hypothetical protein
MTPELKRKCFLQLLKNEHIPPPKLEQEILDNNTKTKNNGYQNKDIS